jgi:hypothetical protein
MRLVLREMLPSSAEKSRTTERSACRSHSCEEGRGGEGRAETEGKVDRGEGRCRREEIQGRGTERRRVGRRRG